MTGAVSVFLRIVGAFFLIYLSVYASFLFASVAVGAYDLYRRDRMRKVKNELKHGFYMPVSIIVPAHNEEVTIVESVESLLRLDYRLYEIIVVDDGSEDGTAEALTERFKMKEISRPIRLRVPCRPASAVYETRIGGVILTLIRKENGGKGDALNMGVNASRYPYFLCIDADSMLQRESLERIVRPVLESDNVVAVGGMVRVAQGVKMEDGVVKGYHLPGNMLIDMQIMEYDRAFMAARILMNRFNGNLIISGAFGLFKKDVVVAAGGYDSDTLGEDMELVMRLHAFCRSNMRSYSILYEPGAVCWSQAPATLGDLGGQRRRWHLGLFQSLVRHRRMIRDRRYGISGFFSYAYYLLYELFSPQIETFGLVTVALALAAGQLNFAFMVRFYVLYAFYGAVLTMTAFFQRIYTQELRVSPSDALRACLMCLTENLFFRFFLDFVRSTAFIGYKKKRRRWGEIKRVRQENAE